MEPRKKYENVKVSVSKWSSHNKYSYIVMPPIIIIFLAENMVTLSRQCCLVPTIDSKTMFIWTTRNNIFMDKGRCKVDKDEEKMNKD